MNTMLLEAEIFKLFLLVFVRVGGMFVSAPVLGSASYPNIAKIGLTGAIAMLITPTLPALATPLPDDGLAFATIAMGELMIGILLGFVITLVFAAVQVGGQIMDLQTGFGMMNIFNPALETQFPVFGFFLFVLAVVYMLSFGWHHMLIKALAGTYATIPVGGVVFRPELFLEMSRWGNSMFIDGLMIAAPVAAAMVMAYMTMGLLGRVVPQIHLFVIGFPITLSIGLFLTALMVGVYLRFLDGAFYRTFRQAEILVRGLG